MSVSCRVLNPVSPDGCLMWFFVSTEQEQLQQSFLGQAYADFGLPGVWIEALAAGFVMQVAYVKFLRGKKSIIRLVAFTFIFMALGELAITNPIIILFQLGIVTALLLVMTLDMSRWIFEASGTVKRALMNKSRITGSEIDS